MNSEHFSIRPLAQEDLPKVLEIENRVHVAPWALGHFQSEMAKPFSRCWVVTDDETDEVVTAYLIGWILFEEGNILNIAVDHPFRRKGFAKHLIRKFADTAAKSGAKRVVLSVRKSNQAAIQLYQSMNFSIVRVQKAAYSNGEDAYEMELSLEEGALDWRTLESDSG